MRPVKARLKWLIALAGTSFAVGLIVGNPSALTWAAPPVNCADAVNIAKSRAALEFQGGSGPAAAAGAETETHLDRAGMAAAAGNQAECWSQLRWSRIGSR